MALILGIETSTKICSVALSNEAGVIAIQEEGGEYSHAEKLNGFITDVLKNAGVNKNQIDAIAVSKGPGSYTGLRIGVSTAKGLCYALNKPLISVDTLQAMALKASREIPNMDYYCPMIDARRMEVYTAIYGADNTTIEVVSARIIEASAFEEYLEDKKLVYFGDGAAKCEVVLGQNSNAIYHDGGFPSAEAINALAFKKYQSNSFEDVAYFEPYYLKDFVATTAKKLL